MKRQLILALFLLLKVSVYSQNTEQTLFKDAIKQHLVRVQGFFNEKSVHYLNPVVLAITNLSQQAIKLKIESGDLLEPVDSSYQTMVITGDLIVIIKPGETKKVEPFGMCIEPHDAAGKKGLAYVFKTNKNNKLREIAQFINQNNMYDPTGQEAIWCVAESGRSLLQINGYDSTRRLKLITKVAGIIGAPVPDKKALRAGYTNYVQPVMKDSIGGEFEFKFSHETNVHIAMFNAQGIIVRELYHNPKEKPGAHKVNFQFDYSIYTDEYYTIKLIANEKVLLTSQIDRNDEGWETE
jgi:hypothetical protein